MNVWVSISSIHSSPFMHLASFMCFSMYRLHQLQEDDYIPLVKEFIGLQKQFEKPHAAGSAISRQQNKKPSSKAKAKAKSAA